MRIAAYEELERIKSLFAKKVAVRPADHVMNDLTYISYICVVTGCEYPECFLKIYHRRSPGMLSDFDLEQKKSKCLLQGEQSFDQMSIEIMCFYTSDCTRSAWLYQSKQLS